MRKALIFLNLLTCICAQADVIRGVVIDESGAVVAGARVEVSPSTLKVSVSGADGSFTVDTGKSNQAVWRLRVSAPGFANTEVNLTPSVKQPVTVRLHVYGPSHEIAVTAR